MSRPTVWGLACALLAIGIAWFAWQRLDNEPLTPPPVADPQATAPPASAGPATTNPASDEPAAGPWREPATPSATDTLSQRLATYPQGFRGRVIDERNQPLVGVRVYLLQSARNEPLALPTLQQQGLLMGPVSETRSGADGSFALGLQLATDKLYEVRLLSQHHADLRLGDLRVLANEWHDLGAVTMLRGTTVRGRVTIEGSQTPIPGATVRIEAASAFEDAAIQGIPGRDGGMTATTDANGDFEFPNAPANGLISLNAMAPGFARITRRDIDMSAPGAIEVHFGLPLGLQVGGHVFDADDGQPIRGARLEAWPTTPNARPGIGHSRADGSFTIAGLLAQPHRLRITARGYQDAELADLAAGRSDLVVKLPPRATVAVRVTTPDGSVIRAFRLGLRRWFETGDDRDGQIGRVVEVPDQRARLAQNEDRFRLPGAPSGQFVVQVTAEGWAKTLSTPFTVAADSRDVTVDLSLTPGARLRGRVVDERQQPLANATVTTQVNGARPENPMWRMLQGVAPDRITALTVETDANGDFALERLAYGTYQLEIVHPDACRHLVTDLALDDTKGRDLGAIRLPSGALIFGRAMVNGRVPSQIKVVLASVADATAPAQPQGPGIHIETVTDSTGAFALPRRVPPGEYEIKAAVIGNADPGTQIFAHLLQLQRSAKRLTVLPGQTHVQQHIDLPSQN